MAEAKLFISGPTESKTVRLDPKGASLGRGSSCDIVLEDSNVSRVHAWISQDPFGRWIVEDMGGQNGTMLEGQRIQTQAVLPGQEITIRPFTLVLTEGEGERTTTGEIPIVDKALEEDITPYRGEHATVLSEALMQQLNELTNRLLGLSSPSELYHRACISLAEMLDTFVAIVRLPRGPAPLPKSPDILACHFRRDSAGARGSYLHLSKRVLDAVRSADAPVKASNKAAEDRNIELTIVDKQKPHLVFSARVNDLGETVDVLYVDILAEKSPDQMFDFVEAAARQIDFAQKNLFLVELKKQEEALRSTNEQLRQKDRIKDEYVSRVTHDIKGHLAAIQSSLYIVKSGPADSLIEQQSEFLGRALHRTTQLTDFVKELLNLTQMRLSGRMQMESFSLRDSISKSLAGIEAKAEEKSITVSSDVAESVGSIVGNEFSITEMITNLLFNAVKYTPEGKSVRLEAKGSGDGVEIRISDTGIGIPADEVGSVFEEFFRASNARRSEKDGTGLGLSIVKQIVERHGGKINVQSKEGEGTTFTVILPRDCSGARCS
ncbi:MAG TPA: ATP-binding protein [Sedimentisphaerales bacterium]|nr:ATP-binding protein [Sedimentisphaerales bacterium]